MQIEDLETEDGVGLQLAYFEPREPDAPFVICTHGVANTFTTSPLWPVAKKLNDQGWGIAILNNRGNGWVSTNPLDRRWMGAAYERIEDSVLDFQAALRWLRERGQGRIVIAGHSLGGLKAAYTQAFFPADDVIALAMFSSPRLPDEKVWDWQEHQRLLARCREMVDQGRGEELMHVDMPTNTPAMKGLMCFRTYVNKYGPDAVTTTLRFADRIGVPTLLLAGELEKPQLSFSIDMESTLVKTASVRRVMIEGCDHIYSGKHEQVAEATHSWLTELARTCG